MQGTFRHIGIMGACFQVPHCHTWIMTNGNALCSLMKFVFQHITLTRLYKLTYRWYEYYELVISNDMHNIIRNPQCKHIVP